MLEIFFILDTDASSKTTGTELLQVQEGVEWVTAYSTRMFSLQPTQHKYCATRLELFALARFTREY